MYDKLYSANLDATIVRNIPILGIIGVFVVLALLGVFVWYFRIPGPESLGEKPDGSYRVSGHEGEELVWITNGEPRRSFSYLELSSGRDGLLMLDVAQEQIAVLNSSSNAASVRKIHQGKIGTDATKALFSATASLSLQRSRIIPAAQAFTPAVYWVRVNTLRDGVVNYRSYTTFDSLPPDLRQAITSAISEFSTQPEILPRYLISAERGERPGVTIDSFATLPASAAVASLEGRSLPVLDSQEEQLIETYAAQQATVESVDVPESSFPSTSFTATFSDDTVFTWRISRVFRRCEPEIARLLREDNATTLEDKDGREYQLDFANARITRSGFSQATLTLAGTNNDQEIFEMYDGDLIIRHLERNVPAFYGEVTWECRWRP